MSAAIAVAAASWLAFMVAITTAENFRSMLLFKALPAILALALAADALTRAGWWQ